MHFRQWLSVMGLVQDRHNGNILMDDVGRIIHIDFGFMLSNSPGGVNFEAAPFKLTRELLEIMDSNSEGHASEIFDYFKVRCPPVPSRSGLCRTTCHLGQASFHAFSIIDYPAVANGLHAGPHRRSCSTSSRTPWTLGARASMTTTSAS